MTTIPVHPIGTVRQHGDHSEVVLVAGLGTALAGLDGFGHATVLWWADRVDASEHRSRRTRRSPYAGGPERLGVFATRSEARPNPIGLSVTTVEGVDVAAGVLRCGWLDAMDGTPVLDIKPYTPSVERVAAPRVPGWAAGWPGSLEESAAFDWSTVLRHG